MMSLSYKENHGDLDIKQIKDRNLHDYCRMVRLSQQDSEKGKIKLTDDFIASLDALVFKWTLSERKMNVTQTI